MIQQIRSNKLLPAATTEKVLLNITPSTTVPIVRAYGLPSAATVLKLFPTSHFLTNESGDYVTDEDGNHFEVLI